MGWDSSKQQYQAVALREEGDLAELQNIMLRAISIHALREEGDRDFLRTHSPVVDFYPRPPRGGRPGSFCLDLWAPCISIHALREEGDLVIVLVAELTAISIHALREEGDEKNDEIAFHVSEISIHALREEGDRQKIRRLCLQCYFYPRPPRGGRLLWLCA